MRVPHVVKLGDRYRDDDHVVYTVAVLDGDHVVLVFDAPGGGVDMAGVPLSSLAGVVWEEEGTCPS